MVELIICEKPAQAAKVAEAIADKKPSKKTIGKVSYYELKHNNKEVMVACAVGHLFTIAEKNKKAWTYPIFEFEWKPSYEVSKDSKFSKAYFDVIKKLSKTADEFTVACDFDIEGCLPDFEKILIKKKGITYFVSIGQFINENLKNPKKYGEFEYKTINDVLIPTVDFNDWSYGFKKIKKVMKRKGDGKLLKITLENGRKIYTSKNHPLFIINPEGMSIRKAVSLNVGDYLPIAKKLPYIETAIPYLDLINSLKERIDQHFYIYGFAEFIDKSPLELSKLLKIKRKTYAGWKFFDRIPLWAYLKIEQNKDARKFLKIGVKKSKTKIPVIIELNAKLGRLLGYYLAEGCIDSSGFVGFYFGPHESNLVNEVKDIFSFELGLNNIKNRMLVPCKGKFGTKEISAPEIGTKSKIFRILIQEIFKLGINSHNKQLPDFIFSTPNEFLINLIDAYLVGDGSVVHDSKSNRYIVSCTSVSHDLINGLHMLLLKLGINSSLTFGANRDIYYLSISTHSELKKMLDFSITSLLNKANITKLISENNNLSFSPLSCLPNFLLENCQLTKWADYNKDYGTRTNIQSILKPCSFVENIISSGIHLLKVRIVEEIDYNGDLFDIETETSSFLHGNGIITHNSTIGFNIIKFLCNKEDARRMKFSTLTKDELLDSYEHAMPHLDFPQIESGITRHSLDWLFGINMSRALTLSIKNSGGGFKLLSTGRVQGPALKILADREHEIKAFIPEPFWQIGIKTENGITAFHKEDKIFDKQKAESIFNKIKGNDAIVSKIDKKDLVQEPPHPFDLTSLQLESYKVLRISPKETLALAQNLYINGYISYPRTSSHQLPESLGYKKIMEGIARQDRYNMLAKEILKSPLKPNNGNKSDPAHPAIHPTTEIPKNLNDREAKIYDLIVHRTLATFAPNAVMETMNVDLNVKSEIFIAKGIKTKISGWHKFYGPYLMLKEKDLPEIKENETLKVNKSELISKETQPPRRYTPASIIKELNKKKIGTKSTRAEIIDNLYQRNYIKNESIEVTDIGLKTIETLEKFCPEIIDEKLTRKFELEMEQIQEKNKAGLEVIEEAKEFLEKTLKHFKKNEKEIGSALAEANKETRQKEIFIGKCPVCKEGDLQIRRGKYGFFAACNRYEQGCSATFTLPKNALLKGAEKNCEACNYPKILVIKARRRPQEICINPNCDSKKQEEEKMKELVKDKKCPNCGSDLIVKSGVYGSFLACPGYPKCKYIENIKKTG